MITCPECGSSKAKNHQKRAGKQWYICMEEKPGSGRKVKPHGGMEPIEVCGRTFTSDEPNDFSKETDNRPSEDRVEFVESGNYAVAETFTSNDVKTLDELIQKCRVDTAVWEVDRWVANKYETPMKVGVKGQERPIIVVQYQIKAWLIRKVPIKHEWPAIQPVRLHRPLAPKFGPVKSDCGTRVLILPDSQNGYCRDMTTGYLNPMHDRQAWDIGLQMAHILRPDRIILMGDMLDLAELTDRFIKMPEFYFTTQAALKELHWWLAQLADTGAQIDYIEGNHEFRLRRAVINNIIAAYSLRPANQPEAPEVLSVENLLGLEDLGVRYHKPYPEAHLWLNDNLRVSHGEVARKGSGDTVKEMLREARNSEITAHSHRLELMAKTVHPRKGPRVYLAYNVGTLARLDIGAVPAAGSRQNWHQGFATGWYEESGGHLHEIYLHAIYGGKMMYQGRVLQARKHLDQMAAEATGIREMVRG